VKNVVFDTKKLHQCKQCGSPLSGPEYVEHHIVDEISNPSPKTCTDFLEYQGSCDVCGHYTIPMHPDRPPEGRMGKNVLVQTTLMRYEDRLPLRKVRDALARQHDLVLAPATILENMHRMSTWIERVYEGIREGDQEAVQEERVEEAGQEDGSWPCSLVHLHHPCRHRANQQHGGTGLKGTCCPEKGLGMLEERQGTHLFEAITSVLTTWRKQGYNTSHMLAQTLTQVFQSDSHSPKAPQVTIGAAGILIGR